jgi:hypothetical protein
MCNQCEHLRFSEGYPWCNGIEYFWEDCCKYYVNRRYKIDKYCYNTDLSIELWKEEIKRKNLDQPICFGC